MTHSYEEDFAALESLLRDGEPPDGFDWKDLKYALEAIKFDYLKMKEREEESK